MLSRRSLAAILAALTLIAGCTRAGAAPSGAPTLEPGALGPRPTLPPGMRLAATVSGQILDLAVDRVRGTVWVPVQSDDGTSNLLLEYSAAGEVGRWALPDFPYAGINLRLKVDESGTVWLKTQTLLVELDPASGLRSASITGVPTGALPAAADDSVMGGGTAITALGVSGGRAVISRRNVPYLAAYDRSLAQKPNIPLPATAMGATDIAVLPDGTMFVAADVPANDILVERPDGTTTTLDVSAGRLTPDGSRLLASDGSGLPTWVADDAPPEVVPGVPAPDAVTVDPRGGVTVAVEARLLRVDGGKTVSELDIPTWSVTSVQGMVMHNVPVVHVDFLATDANGLTWIADGHSLYTASL